jgi:hypothetical protein
MLSGLRNPEACFLSRIKAFLIEHKGYNDLQRNEGCLPLCEKAALAIHYSTWRIWGELLPPPAQVCGDQPCAGTGGGCGVEKGWLQISLFCSEDRRLRCEMVKFAQSIGIGNQ